MPRRFALPSTASSKDPAYYPAFRGQITRGIWRIYTQRLTPAGRWMLLVSSILIGYGGSSLQIQAFVLASYLIVLWLIAIAAALLLRPRMELKVDMPYRVAAGDVLIATVHVRQRRRLHGGDASIVPWNLSAAIDSVLPDGVNIPDLSRGKTFVTKLAMRFNARGLQQLKGFRITSSFPFGMIRSRSTHRVSKAVLVYPSFQPLERIALPTGGGQESSAELIASRLGESFEFLGNREFRQGDSPRDINWRATARMPQPIVREWIEERQVRVCLFLDDTPDGQHAARAADSFERVISMTAAIAEVLLRQQVTIRLLQVGHSATLEGTPHRSPDLESVLDLLATIKPAAASSTLPSSLLLAASRGDVILMVLPCFDPVRRGWYQQLAELTTGIKAIVIGDSDGAVHSPSNDVVCLSVEQFSAGVGAL